MEALSDDDLDSAEIIALLLIIGAPLDPTLPLNTGMNRLILEFTKLITECFQHMTKRQKREYEVWWVLYLAQGCVTDEDMRRTFRQFSSLTTKDERAALLTGMRTTAWDFANCSDIP